MTAPRTAHVHLTGPGRGTVTVDGVELHGVTAVTVGAAVGELSRLVVDVVLREATVEGEMHVTVPPKTAATLVALGWTAPTEQEVTDAAPH